jgi:hypothetical protein
MKLLKKNCYPTKYNLFLDIDLNKNYYYGFNHIELNIIYPTNIIEFHASILNITSIKLNNDIINNIKYDNENQIYTIYLDNILNKNMYNLDIYFDNYISNSDSFMKYINELKNNRTIYYTRFEPISARKCYPCFDEPIYKIKYNLTIKINDPTYDLLFNTDPISIQKINNDVIYKFIETISMPTYINSFIIGKFNYIEKYSNHNIRIRIYIPKDEDINSANFALNCSVKTTDFLINYTQIKYPYNKIDFIGVDNLSAGGCENYGLIYCNMNRLLFDIKTTSYNTKIEIVTVIVHELVHMWFGNLVSTKKWNDIWLKEGFARYYENYIISILYPEFNIYSRLNYNLLSTLNLNSSINRTTISEITNITYITNIYDSLTYNKGAAILTIIVNYIGIDKFRIKIIKYLNKYKFNNVSTKDFLDIVLEDLNYNDKLLFENLINKYLYTNGLPIINSNYNNNWNLDYDLYKKYFNNKLINDKINGYYIVLYDNFEFDLNKYSNNELLSIFYDLYFSTINKIILPKYFLNYTSNLLLHLKNKQIDFYLFEYIYKTIHKINNNKLLNKLNELIDNLNILYNTKYINTYINNDYDSINFNYNQIILFLLKINKFNHIINYIFDNNIFDKSYDLNNIVLKYIFENKKITKLKNYLIEDLLDDLKCYYADENTVDNLINDIINNKYSYSIIPLCKKYIKNKYFIKKLLNILINNSTLYFKIFPNHLNPDVILTEIINSQTDKNIIDNIFIILDKYKTINNQKLTFMKNIAYNKLNEDIKIFN